MKKLIKKMISAIKGKEEARSLKKLDELDYCDKSYMNGNAVHVYSSLNEVFDKTIK